MRTDRDAFRADVELALQDIFYPLGYPACIETNSEDVMRAAEECWGSVPAMFEAPPVRVALAVTPGGRITGTQSHFYAREHVMSVYANADNFLLLDFERGYASGSVTRPTAMDHPLLRYRFLIPAAHMLVEQRAMMPLHGALVARGGRGVLLTGDSFAGKSTLAYACARAGWTYVADDGTFLIRGREGRRAVGDPSSLRLREGARAFFPELRDHLAVVRPNGKIAIEVLTRDLPIETAYGCSIDHVVFLDRQEECMASVEVVDKGCALETFRQHISFGTSQVRQAQLDSLKRLADAGLWRLRYAGLDDAITELERLVCTGA